MDTMRMLRPGYPKSMSELCLRACLHLVPSLGLYWHFFLMIYQILLKKWSV